MKTHLISLFTLLSLVLLGISCTPEVAVTSASGLKPLYASGDDLNISLRDPMPYGQLGQIVYVDPYLLIGETYRGIHVVDNTNPSNPSKMSFINIPGCNSFTVGDGVIYATSGKDLVTLTFDGETLVEKSRLEEYFNGNDAIDQVSPLNYSGFFECVDSSQGTVIGWVEDIINNPQCRTQ